MKKILLFVLLLTACAQQEPAACTEEAQLCPDGSTVGRTGPHCAFAPCPDTTCDQPHRTYTSKNQDDCSRIRFQCAPELAPFSDNCGCGCEEKQEQHCTPQDRTADACIELYQPVCGWSDPQKIQCIKYPCAQTFPNNCFACMDENVHYWTEGACPI